ncbi:LLM class flavin-dependent oxidoreductase [Staphylococcus equorum]|uniref:LLM class flavin-dependent oxidoreductase n=1 Tax=Staphylococcus equorum TaxID=246432 RepID=A0A9X4LB20_9STAP|nr:LLM class flavin-dependent oxidoreductase [Staphylococcus equorum]MDG0843657.1 LLM class flavin-dependent oxidoreductase [Staphylococcus equorum]MDG0859788.1 LLM class flavin-dependent oxidoreductase [Staphylococcus equorum]
MKLSILDYVPIFEGRNATQALNHTVELAQLAESLGFYRYWVAEHHQVFSVASSAPEMVMMSLLEQTSSIHIGSGGIMLPHYSAYKIAEQLKLMEARHPGRVDLGTGRSPSFKNVNHALNETKTKTISYKTQINDLMHYFNDDTNHNHRFKGLQATPLITTKPSMYILGMSKQSAAIAAEKGLPFVIALMGQANHNTENVINHYRDLFKQFHPQSESYVIISTFVITAEHQSLITQLERAFHLWLVRISYLDQPEFYPSIEFAMHRQLSKREEDKMNHNQNRVISGLPTDVMKKLNDVALRFSADEIMIQPHVFGETHRKTLLKLIAKENMTE